MNQEAPLLDLARDNGQLLELLQECGGESLVALNQRLGGGHLPEPVRTMCAELFHAGGKRLRALATFVVAAAADLEASVAIALAEVVELSHGATLLHDDVIDEADTRRGTASARRRWSNTLSILGGDLLLLRSLDVVAGLDNHPVAELHRKVLYELLAAEVAQHVAKRDREVSVSGYLDIAAGKTGALFAFACAAPFLYRGDEDLAGDLYDFGLQFGVAFQIADDLRDVLTADSTKTCNLDLKDGILSLPLRLSALRDDALLEDLFSLQDRSLTAEQIHRISKRVLVGDTLSRSIAIGREHLERARGHLQRRESVLELRPLTAVSDWLVAEFTSMET